MPIRPLEMQQDLSKGLQNVANMIHWLELSARKDLKLEKIITVLAIVETSIPNDGVCNMTTPRATSCRYYGTAVACVGRSWSPTAANLIGGLKSCRRSPLVSLGLGEI